MINMSCQIGCGGHQMEVYGIPYFGVDTIEKEKRLVKINDKDIQTREYSQLYSFIQENISKKALVIIDNQWFTWLNDIEFNYRDKTVSIPYYKYSIELVENDNDHENGHIIVQDDRTKIGIRYDFELNRQELKSIDQLKIYKVDNDELEIATWNKWMGSSDLDKTDAEILDKLYKLYKNQAIKSQDSDHLGGYHFILKHTGFQNIEYQKRQQLSLGVFKSDRYKYDEYRDVRQYRQTELTSADKEELEKLKESNQSEWLKHNRDRRLTFESYLYTLCRSGRLDNIKFNHGIYKISRPGQAVKLIIKQYWLDGYQKRQATYIK